MNLSELVDRSASDLPDHPALVFGEQAISYSELLVAVNKLANTLVKSGVQKGDRVAIIMGNRPELIIGYLATVRVGAIAVTLNPASTPYELSHYFADSKPAVVICTGDQVPKINTLKDRTSHLRTVIGTEAVDGAVSFDDVQKGVFRSIRGCGFGCR